jgi:ABC-type nitrate/sulfonate/bicarbonate transport system permease component
VFAAIVILGLMGALVHAAFQLLESWTLKRWRGR